MAWACTALTTGDAAATRLPVCALYVNGSKFRNAPAAYPGPFAATAAAETRLRVGTYVQVCVRAVGIWLDNSSDSTNFRCTPSRRL